jgi:arylsulfatase A-like enzyme
MRVGLLLLALMLGSCQTTRVAELEREMDQLEQHLEVLSHRAGVLNRALQRQKDMVAGEQMDQWPEDWDPDGTLPAGDPRRPDVILLSIDTLRADHLGAWGYERDTSPFFDELAAGGTRYKNAWAASPWTLPSHTTMLSGLLPPHHGAIEDTVRIGDDIPMVQEMFRHEGYGTGGVVATLFVSSRFGFDRGFDFFYDFDIRGATMNNASTVDAEHVFAWATDWVQQQPEGKPIFLFLHVYDVHYGYNPPAPFNELFDRPVDFGDVRYKDYHHYKKHPLTDEQLAHQTAQYDEEIAYVDQSFRTFVENWRATRPAIVVVTSDHGEELGERGSWGHAHTLFPEQLHVPMIINGPGVRRQVISERFGAEDLASTLAGVAGTRWTAHGKSRRVQA